jgi:hypothetical protein
MGVDIVTLKPPTSWHMDYFGEDNDEVGDYRLRSLGKNKTKIEVRFRNRWKGSMSLSTEEKQKIESDAWDQCIAELEKEFASTKH